MFIATAVFTLFAFSCQKPDAGQPDKPEPVKPDEPTAITEITANLEGAGIKTEWAEGDAIIVYAVTDAGETSAKYVLSKAEGVKGTFKSDKGLNSGATAYYACYPYSDITFAQHNTFSYTIEAEQETANPVFGTSTDGKVYTFSSPLAGLELKLKGKGNAARIALTAKNSENILNGNATFNAMTKKLTVKNVAASKNEVAKAFQVAALGETAVSFFMEVPAGTLEQGADIIVYNAANGMIGKAEIPAQQLVAGRIATVETTLEEVSSVADLSAIESANCYIITEPGAYKFHAVKGNTPSVVGNGAKAEILWETYNNNEEVAANSVIASVEYANDYVTFKTPSTLKKGNALVAVKDANDVILWSWHIWVVADQVVEGTMLGYEEGAEIMNCNLGALGEAGTPEGLGFVYAWGRKDPFLSIGNFEEESIATVSGLAETIAPDKATVTSEFATQNPTYWVLVEGTDGNKDWTSDHDNTRWGADKGVEDPCPVGWKVPATDDNPFFSEDTMTQNEAETVFFINKEFQIPNAYSKSYSSGSLSKDAKYFTCVASGDDYGYAWRHAPAAIRRKAEGCSIRCMKITSAPAE